MQRLTRRTQQPATVASSDRTVTDEARAASAARRAATNALIPQQTEEAFAELTLTPVAGQVVKAGWTPKTFMESDDGARYIVKDRLPGQGNFELAQLANQTRMAAGEPAVPLYEMTFQREGAPVAAFAAPMLKGAGPLPAIEDLSPEQIATVLADAPWFEVLGNYDTRPNQYVSLEGPDGQRLALNVDWDKALSDFEKPQGQVTRHKSGYPRPPTQNRLFYAFVRGKDVDFAPLFESIERIQAVDDDVFRKALEPAVTQAFADGEFGDYTSSSAVIDDMLSRKAKLFKTFDQLVSAMELEKAQREGKAPKPSRRQRLHQKRMDAGLVAGIKYGDSKLAPLVEKLGRTWASIRAGRGE